MDGSMEERILRLFADRYPGSAARCGGKPLRIRDWRKILPEAFITADASLAFLDTVETLERKGLLGLVWEKRRKGDELAAADLLSPPALYERLGQPTPEMREERFRESADRAAVEAADRGDAEAAAAFRRASSEAAPLSENFRPADLADAAVFLAQAKETVDRLPLRALSIRLYRDSKRLESVLPLLERLLADRLPRRAYPEVAIAGTAELVFMDGSVWPLRGRSLSLSWNSAEALVAIRPPALAGSHALALSVENKETFHHFAQFPGDFAVVVASGGRPNRAVRAVLRLLANAAWSVHHAGDLDPDGLAILGEVRELCGAEPLGMDAATFERYRAYGRKLESAIIARLRLIPVKVRELDGMETLIGRIAETGLGVEQEIIDYGPLSVLCR